MDLISGATYSSNSKYCCTAFPVGLAAMQFCSPTGFCNPYWSLAILPQLPGSTSTPMGCSAEDMNDSSLGIHAKTRESSCSCCGVLKISSLVVVRCRGVVGGSLGVVMSTSLTWLQVAITRPLPRQFGHEG
eukprot:533548-Amphidinium_carterae.3